MPTTILALPRSSAFWRDILREPLHVETTPSFPGSSIDELDHDQLARLRDLGLTPSEAAAVVLAACADHKNARDLAITAAEVCLEGLMVAVEERPELRGEADAIARKWRADEARLMGSAR